MEIQIRCLAVGAPRTTRSVEAARQMNQRAVADQPAMRQTIQRGAAARQATFRTSRRAPVVAEPGTTRMAAAAVPRALSTVTRPRMTLAPGGP
jgi:hypothetical protein